MTKLPPDSDPPYRPDYRLHSAFREAVNLSGDGLETLCPSYTELSAMEDHYDDAVLLGSGAVKDVYKTFNRRTKSWVAMARLRSDRGPEFYDWFIHEAWLTASLNHPNIIKVHDVGVDEDGRPYFVMDLKGNSTLADRSTGVEPSPQRELLDVFVKVCDAVAYAQSKGVVHLDLKPENIQADEFGEVLVCDWGLAKVMGETEEGENGFPPSLSPLGNTTLVGQIKGSLGYLAPEQLIPGATKDFRSDLFALGCVLHQILTGQAPFCGTVDERIDATKRAEIGSLRKKYPERNIPEALEAVVLKSTSPDPDDRYASVVELRQEIAKFLGGYSTLAEKPSFVREARLFVARNQVPVLVSMVAIVAISVLGVLSVQRVRQQRARASHFASQADAAKSLYQDERERSEQQLEALAKDLATSASEVKKLGIYLNPVETVREARKLVASALKLNPVSHNAKLQQFSLDCITLNFNSALQSPVRPQSRLHDYLLFAEAFPEFDFSEHDRPTISQLTHCFQQAYQLNPNRRALLERIAAYDHTTRDGADDYTPVVKALLSYINGFPDDSGFQLNFDAERSSLHFRCDAAIRLAVWNDWGSNDCVLRFLPFRSLSIDSAGPLFLHDLSGLQVERLDLSDCQTLVANQQVQLPQLRQIIVPDGFVDSDSLVKQIRSNQRIDVIDSPEEG
ncbi:serine/threonine protein kinase [Crateriforma conspicua]|uniref:Serine/threonine-protein kinase PknB n=1 Tax=Crateriforma conspicua TaxID=2527996 RepID=A0A5C5Y137_9PLAN|nr:serine/threonine-protein kinase [Crateriforma conspicua]TWT68934.1 Serine/threonine-protein kinase PknB [Crateriforma conspicua]